MTDLTAIRTAAAALLAQIDTAIGNAPIVVRAGDNLFSILETAPAGARIVVDHDVVADRATYTFIKPVKLLSAGLSVPGRVDATLRGPTLRGAITMLAPDVHCYGLRFEGLTPDSTLVTTGERTLLDQCAVIGTDRGQHRGVAANSVDVVIAQSHIGNIWKDQEAQAVSCWKRTKNLRILDTTLEASGMGFMAGGADCAEADIPDGILLDTCTLTKRPAWRGMIAPSGAAVMCKNAFELKNAKHVTLRHSLLEYSWPGGGQAGYGIVLSVRNQGGTAPWATVEDVLLDSNIIRDVGAGILLLGRDSSLLRSSQVMQRVTIKDNLLARMNRTTWGGVGRTFHIAGGPQHVSILNHRVEDAVNVNSMIYFENPQWPIVGFKVLGGRFYEGGYGIVESDAAGFGEIVLRKYAPDYQWADVTVVKGSGRARWPEGTMIV